MALQELFFTRFGIFSLITILGVIVIGIFYIRYFSNRIAEDERRIARQQAAQQRERSAKAS
ncbi:MAG: DUF3149 domain-containing protein [Azoarcus sp.]|jgi:uncharacterized membrane protein YciS (DUF1049 family)|nr:DUF3149 domain-containing protein [Azoarcus sp.]